MSFKPIIIVTGANNGVGFGTCRRLLDQLSQPSPDDALPIWPTEEGIDDGLCFPCDGLTLIMACRNTQRGEAARKQLLELFEQDVQSRAGNPGHLEHAKVFRENLEVRVHPLDLASVKSVLDFGEEMNRTYPYVSTAIFNAGVAPFTGIRWFAAIKQILMNFVDGVTRPKYYTEEAGLMSDDGLGWVWQCNVFGHYILWRTIQPLLTANMTHLSTAARVIWVSSLEAFPQFHDTEDWQLIKSHHSYEGSKYQTNLIAAHLDLVARRNAQPVERHFITHPGIVHSSIGAQIISPFLHQVKLLTFYIARWLGSPHHNITYWNGAAAAVHLTLVSLTCIPLFLAAAFPSAGSKPTNGDAHEVDDRLTAPLRFHSISNQAGMSSVALDPVDSWAENREEAEKMVARCEKLYQTFLAAEGRTGSGDTVTNGHAA